jgi:uncharacterized protein YggE
MIQRKFLVGVSSLVASLVLVAAFALGWVAIGGANLAQAQAPSPAAGVRSVTVVGEGSVSIEPDIARANIGVEVVQATVQEAVAEAREVMEAVLAALEEAGVAAEDIQTSGYNIWAERHFGEMSRSNEEQVRYRVSNNVSVTIRDLEEVSAVLDAAIDAGANNIYGVNFGLDDPTTVESEAREKAVENALAKAEELAGLTGTEIGAVISISEVIGQGGGYFGGNFAASARDGLGGGGAGPIAPGQLRLTMQLQITYELQ